MRRLLGVGALVGAILAQSSASAQISAVSRGGGSTNAPPVIAGSGLGEDSLCFVDRTHEYNDVPPALQGAQYILTANNDKSVVDYSLTITIDADADLMLILDNRIGDGNRATPPRLGGGVMDWVLDMGFQATAHRVEIDEGGDGTNENTSTVYLKHCAAGDIVVLEQDDGGGRNMYGVAAKAIGQAGVTSALPATSPLVWALGALVLLIAGGFLLRR